MTTDIKPPRALADEVTPEQVGIYAGNGEPLDPSNPHNVTKASIPEPEPEPTNDPKEFDPRIMGEPEPGPLELPPVKHGSAQPGRHSLEYDPGVSARMLLKDRSLKARAKRMWNWIKFLTFMAILIIGAVVYWQYTVRKHTYVVEPRICFFETADKQVKLTGTRYYSYTQNEMLGVRWAHNDETTVKTELNINGTGMVIASIGGKDGPTSKYIPQGEQGTVVMPVADTYIITLEKRSVILSADTFCR